MNLRQLHEAVFDRCLKGISLELLQQHAGSFLVSYLPSQWCFPALFRLHLAKQLGCPVLILSSSPSFLVKRVAHCLHVDLWNATEYQVDREGRLCHIEKIMEGEEKVVAMNRVAQDLSIPFEQTVAYSDSIEDLPLLTSAGIAVAVNPDKQLFAISQKNGWEIL